MHAHGFAFLGGTCRHSIIQQQVGFDIVVSEVYLCYNFSMIIVLYGEMLMLISRRVALDICIKGWWKNRGMQYYTCISSCAEWLVVFLMDPT